MYITSCSIPGSIAVVESLDKPASTTSTGVIGAQATSVTKQWMILPIFSSQSPTMFKYSTCVLRITNLN